MFSDRFSQESREFNAQWETKLSLEADGLHILDLTESNPTNSNLKYPSELPGLLSRASILRYTPTPQGHPEARQAISEYYRSRGRDCHPENLILTTSTSEAYSFLFKLLCNPGDEVLIPSPSYPLFDSLAELENVELVRYPLLQARGSGVVNSHWQADFEFLRSQISTHCKALILVNPNNPTGNLLDAAEVHAYLELATEYGLALIVDEVFCDYALGAKPFVPLVSDGPLVFTLNGFSKLLGLPQMKLGWIHVAGAPSIAIEALGHLEWIADAFLSVNTPVQLAAADLLKLEGPIQSSILARLKSNLETVESLTKGSERLRCLRPEAGWSLVLEVNIAMEDEAFALELLKQHKVLVHAGRLFGFETGCYLVISLLGPVAEFKEGVSRILSFAEAASH